MCERPSRSPAILPGVDVDADHLLARLGERDGERQPDVAQADDSDAHAPYTVPSGSRRRPRSAAASRRACPRRRGTPRTRRRWRRAPASRSQRGAQPSRSRARAASSRSTGASPAAASGAPARTSSPPGQRSREPLDEPADRARVVASPGRSSTPTPPRRRRRAAARRPRGSPRAGTSTCCHGRTASGARSVTGSPASAARMQSATSRSGAQSPPPITLPARTVASGSPSARNAAATCSCAALEAEYGSSPPSGSSSRNGVAAPVVAVALVARHDDDGARLGLDAQRLEHLGRAGHVDGERLDRLARAPRRTSACAARWITTSGCARATAARTSLFERTSPRTSPAMPVGDVRDLVQRRLARPARR